jgi:transcriptional regulator with PAS, ATPase and Fis domain
VNQHSTARNENQDLQLRLDQSYEQLEIYARELKDLLALQPDPSPGLPGPSTVELVGKSEAIQSVIELCHRGAEGPTTVLLLGETGTGKELAARLIHDWSSRHDGPFVAVNCAALPESLAEAELFGHEKGGFTGATERRLGQFELAQHGTIFLDEIGELSLPVQGKLLRVLEDMKIRRVGGSQLVQLDVRVIAATNRDLEAEAKAGRFRLDLFYRLNVFPITMPALAERISDVRLLVEHFLHQLGARHRIASPTMVEEAVARLEAHPWPGNVRELRNVIERGMLLARGGPIEARHLPAAIGQHASPSQHSSRDTRAMLANQERAMVVMALEECGWNKAQAAKKLGISWHNISYRIKKYKLTPSDSNPTNLI